MTTIKAFIKSHPLLSFYALAFAITWGGLIMVVGGPSKILGNPDLLGPRFAFVMLAWLAGPSVASILMTCIVNGSKGLRDLFTRMTRWRVGARWYAVALLSAPLLVTAILFALSLSSPEYLPTILTTSDKGALLLQGIVGTFVGGIFEELGWTGFVTHTLLRRMRHGVLATGLFVGVLWGVAHLPLYYWGASDDLSGALLVTVVAANVLAWFPPYRVLMVWVYDRTESLLLAMLMHGSATGSLVILASLAGMALFIYTLAFGAVLWIVVGAVALANHGHLSRQPRHRHLARLRLHGVGWRETFRRRVPRDAGSRSRARPS
jgi:membrane protease YdiL (CAAX protease family)